MSESSKRSGPARTGSCPTCRTGLPPPNQPLRKPPDLTERTTAGLAKRAGDGVRPNLRVRALAGVHSLRDVVNVLVLLYDPVAVRLCDNVLDLGEHVPLPDGEAR